MQSMKGSNENRLSTGYTPSTLHDMELLVTTIEDLDRHRESVCAAADQIQQWIRDHEGDSMDLLWSLKFEAVGSHPVMSHPLNAIEQINQTFTFAVALEATRILLARHPEAGGFRLAPGAHMSLPLDIMSVEEGLVGAETFATVDPRNKRKLTKDLDKLSARTERHR